MSVRTRFEILKRDGFRCRYCGATAAQSMLHVDHVLALSEGGTDDPSNLVAACSDCNLGKSNKPIDVLDPKRSGSNATAEAMLEHAAQVRAYLDATRDVEAARDETVAWLAGEWSRRIGYVPPKNAAQVLRAALLAHPIERILRAFDATGGGASRLDTNLRVIMYFRACLKNMRDADGSAAARAICLVLNDYRNDVIASLPESVSVSEDTLFDNLPEPVSSLQCTLSGAMPEDQRALILEAFDIERRADDERRSR